MKMDKGDPAIWALDLDALGEFYRDVLRQNDKQVIRWLILHDRFFLLTMVLDVRVAWHPWILERCREVEREPDEHLDLWSRGHFKSTIITYAGVAQYVLANPEHSVCIMSYKSGAAEAFSSQIKTAFETNDILLRCFPDVLYPERTDHRGDQWTVSDFTVKRRSGRKEATVSTSGLVSGMRTGGHYDLLVYDDTVTPESVTTPDQIQKTTDAWSMSLNLGTLSTKHWYIGTRYAVHDTYAEMISRGTIKERRHICVDDSGRPVLLSPVEFAKKRAEMTSKDWASQMLQSPVGDGELLFNDGWFQTYERTPDIPMNVYIVADTAQGQGSKNDYTVFWVIGLAADKRYYVLDCIRDRIKQTDRSNKLFALVEKWCPDVVFYEVNAAPDDVDFITDRMAERGRFNLKGFRQKSNSGPKEQRIETLEPVFREGLILFPTRIHYRQYDGSVRDLVRDFRRDEYDCFPSVVHDDMLDALSAISAGNPDVRPFLRFPSLSNRRAMNALEERRVYGTGSGSKYNADGIYGGR